MAAQAAKKLAEDAKKTLENLKAKIKKTTGIDTNNSSTPTQGQINSKSPTPVASQTPEENAASNSNLNWLVVIFLIFALGSLILVKRTNNAKSQNISGSSNDQELGFLSDQFHNSLNLKLEAIQVVGKKAPRAKKAPAKKKVATKKGTAKKAASTRKKVTKKAPAKKKAVAKKRANN